MDEVWLRFWGVRGSIACPGKEYSRYGGNTPCVEVRCGPHLLVFDGGTGLRPLGCALRREEPLDFDLFFSHTHFDHIVGLPFFKPLFHAGNRLRMWAGHLVPERTLRDVLCVMMQEPLFPVPIETFAARTSYHDFRVGETLHPREGVTLRTAPLNHPNRATGYRVEYGGRSLCYVTDTEHEVGRLDENIVDLVRDSNVFVYDATYTDEEYPRFTGWGHSTWQQGVRLANAANVGTLVLFHHDPGHDDAVLDRIAEEVEAARPGSLVASEGMILQP
ncbi:MAG: MBL fold metallo-hydrolase [Rhodospirillaceae bacterium]|nr:MBL fold metallo-hydrolase [Rhodospirillaceae bacterium]